MLLGIQLLNPASISHRRRLQRYPSHQFHSDFRQWTSFLGIQLFWLPHSGSPPPSCSFWPIPCCLLQAREWADLCAVQKLLNKIISRKPVDQAISRQPNRLAEPIPFILNAYGLGRKVETRRRCWKSLCLQVEEYRTRRATYLDKGSWKHQPSNSNVGS